MTLPLHYVICPVCGPGHGTVWPPPPGEYVSICKRCLGLGRVWAPGAPSYGCNETLGDRIPGEIVVLGTGVVGRVLWHMPRPEPKVRAETTFLSIITPRASAAEDFDDAPADIEIHRPIPFPSELGVADVRLSKMVARASAGDQHGTDENDPVLRAQAHRLPLFNPETT